MTEPCGCAYGSADQPFKRRNTHSSLMVAIQWLSVIGLCVVSAASIHHFGWEGTAIPAAIYLLMPYPDGRR